MERSTLRRYYMWNLAICSVSVLEGLQILWNVCLFLKLGLGKLRDKDLDIGKSGLVIIAYIFIGRLPLQNLNLILSCSRLLRL